MRYDHLSLWLEQVEDLSPRPSLDSSLDADVAIVGAGFTGLWTAYYLIRADPSLRIVILEREIAGFGASGRNGGWASAFFPATSSKVAALPGSSRDAARRMTAALRSTIDEVAEVGATEGIDCHFHKGGSIGFARTKSQLARIREQIAEARAWGDSEDDFQLLGAQEAASVARASGVLGATYTPHCARIHPARLVRGLAEVVERAGVKILEQTAVLSIGPSMVTAAGGRVRADVVIRATEGYTPGLAGMRRAVVPVYSLIVATEPLPASVWAEIGLDDKPTFKDHRHLIIYGQRTLDGRLVFGGRGAPYHFASRIQPGFDREERVFQRLRDTLVDLFPALEGSAFTHAWGGPLGIPRDWMPSVGFDRVTGLGWAGGYVGDGVAATNLAGRTLAELVLGHDTELTALPWVNHRSPSWEPEPLRWLGINAGLRAMSTADAEESWTGRQSLVARALAPMLGGQRRRAGRIRSRTAGSSMVDGSGGSSPSAI